MKNFTHPFFIFFFLTFYSCKNGNQIEYHVTKKDPVIDIFGFTLFNMGYKTLPVQY